MISGLNLARVLSLVFAFLAGGLVAIGLIYLLDLDIDDQLRGALIAVVGFAAAQVALTGIGEWRAVRAEARRVEAARADRVREHSLERIRHTRDWVRRYFLEMARMADGGKPPDDDDPLGLPLASFHVVGDLDAIKAFVEIDQLLIRLASEPDALVTPMMYDAITAAHIKILDALFAQEQRVLRDLPMAHVPSAEVDKVGAPFAKRLPRT